MAKNKKVIKFSKRIDVNVGMIILAVICLYILISIIVYAAGKKTIVYEVNTGSLSLDNVYTAFIDRDEEVITSDYSGTFNYYVHSADKTNKNSVVYSVDEAGRVSAVINEMYNSEMTDEDLYDIANLCSKYTLNYSNASFSKIYDLHNDVYDSLTKLHSNLVLDGIDQIVKDTSSENLFHPIVTEQPGIVMYTYDGFENFQETQLSKELFDTSAYQKKILQNNDLINQQDVAYRLILSDDWNLYIPLSETEATALSTDKTVSIRFIDQDLECHAEFEVLHIQDQYYGKITLHKYMINFADERYVKVELYQNCAKGLKIPLSSVFIKSFYTIPSKYLIDKSMFMRMSYSENGEKKYETIETNIYDVDDDNYLVNMNDFHSGDIIVDPENTEDQFIVGTIGERYGVYCVNKGYAVFKMVNILDENSEYYIVERGSSYGLAIYDHIVLDYESVKENEIVD